jgi:fructose-1-phosphate kinase PfkB-like protein
MLAADGVDAVVVPLAAVTRTCIAVVERAESATSTDVYEPATEFTTAEWDAFASAARATVAESVARQPRPWVFLSGSVPSGVPLAGLGSLLRDLRTAGARVAIDGSGAGLAATAPSADLIKVNRREASELLGVEFSSAVEACRALHDRVGCDAVVTDGVVGSAALIAGSESTMPAASRRGRFPAGSGDAFLGGLLAAFERSTDVEGALAAASNAGERNALVPGQGILGPEA